MVQFLDVISITSGRGGIKNMLSANLLPPNEKRAVAREEWRRVIVVIGASGLAALLIGSVLLVPSYIPLLFEIKSLGREHDLEQEASRIFELDVIRQEVGDITRALDVVKHAATRRPHTRQLFDAVVRDASGITIASFTVRDAVAVSVEGKAALRGDLLAFEQMLRESGLFTQIVSPLSNIIRQADINFTLTGTLKEEFAL